MLDRRRTPAHFPLLQADAEAVVYAGERFIIHCTQLRDSCNYYQVEREQIKKIARQLRHMADVVDTLVDAEVITEVSGK